MIPANLGSSSYYSQYMKDHRRRTPEVSRDRLLTDRDAYLHHLEEQVEKVSAACMLASELRTHHGVLERQVNDLDSKVNNTVQDVREAQAMANVERKALEQSMTDVRDRVTTLESLPDKLVALEVEVDKARKSQNQVMLDKVSDFEERLGRMEQRHQGELRIQQEQISRTTSHLQLVMENNERLERRCRELEEGQRRAFADIEQAASLHHSSNEEAMSRLRDVTLPKTLSEVRLAQERASVETSKELTRVRHEVGMAENRMLAALSKQAALAQEQITQIQDLVSEAIAPSHPPHTAQPYPPPVAAPPPPPPSSSCPAGQDGAMITPAAEVEDSRRLARKVQVLMAAFRHAEDENKRAVEGCRHGITGLKDALEGVQASVREIAGRTLEYAGQQTETVLEAMSRLEQRVDGREEAVNNVQEEVQHMARRLSECWDAVHDVDMRVELINNRFNRTGGSPRRPVSSQNGATAVVGGEKEGEEGGGGTDEGTQQPPPTAEFERVLELCVSMHQMVKRNATELDLLREKVDRTATITTTNTSSSMTPRTGTLGGLLLPPPSHSLGSPIRPLLGTPISPASPSPSPPVRAPMPLKVHVSMRPRASSGGGGGGGGGDLSQSDPGTSVITTISSPVVESARRMVLKSPTKHRQAKEGALEALRVIENMADVSHQQDVSGRQGSPSKKKRDQTLKEVISEVADLFSSINQNEKTRVKRKAAATTTTAASSSKSPSTRLSSSDAVVVVGKRPASAPASSSSTPRTEGAKKHPRPTTQAGGKKPAGGGSSRSHATGLHHSPRRK